MAMRHLGGVALALWAMLEMGVRAQDDVVYVTDMDVFPLLAPCVSSALSYGIQIMTMSDCEENETALQSCICSNSGRSRDVAFTISTQLLYYCETVASDEWTSASQVFSKYCDPDGSALDFPTPTTNLVNEFITDVAEIAYLPECARSAIAGGVMGGPSAWCPTGDASLYAPCVCTKDYVVSHVRSYLSGSVRASCSNNEDVTSAQEFYDDYCNMNNGTTEFDLPATPPGDMTYYITALDQYRDLNSCAQRGVQVIMEQQPSRCPPGPQALASCFCLKSGIFRTVSSSVTYSVKAACDETNLDDVTSVMELMDYYCDAAKGDVVATVTDTAEDPFVSAETRSNGGDSSEAVETGTGTGTESSGGPEATESGGGSSDGSNDGSGSDDGGIGKPALIAAISLGAVVGLLLLAALIWFIRRRGLKAKAAAGGPAASSAGSTKPPNHEPYEPYGGRPELLGSEANGSRVNLANSASPHSVDHPYGKPELYGVEVTAVPPRIHASPQPQSQPHPHPHAQPHSQQQAYMSELHGDGLAGAYPMQDLVSPGGHSTHSGHTGTYSQHQPQPHHSPHLPYQQPSHPQHSPHLQHQQPHFQQSPHLQSQQPYYQQQQQPQQPPPPPLPPRVHQLSVGNVWPNGATEPSPVSPQYGQPPYHGWQSGPVYEVDSSRR